MIFDDESEDQPINKKYQEERNKQARSKAGQYRYYKERIKAYEEGDLSCKHEISTEGFLRRITERERENIHRLFGEILKEDLLRYRSYGLLAVGSITFPYEYWRGLERYFEKHDRTKLDYVKRRGEDIDLILCPDPTVIPYEESISIIEKSLERSKIDFTIEENNQASEAGTTYLTIPEEHREKEEGVIRKKIIDYAGDRFNIRMDEESRPIHLIIGDKEMDTKLKDERIPIDPEREMPFSVLFRHGEIERMKNLIDYIKRSPELF